MTPKHGGYHLAAALLALAVLLAGCAGSTPKAGEDQTLHLKQVLESYDANDEPVPQYLEIWAAPPLALCHELDADGKTIGVMLDNTDGHVQYDASTMQASKSDAEAVFHINFQSIKAAFKRASTMGELDYAGCKCVAWLLENDAEDDWVKAYVDRQTGWVLFCDAPTFRLRTYSVDFVGADERRFATPTGLKFQ